MEILPASAIHYSIPEETRVYPLSSSAAKIIELYPHFILGEANLFSYNSSTQSLSLTPSFQSFLELLIKLKELDSRALEAQTLTELNTILQAKQGENGGLMREAGKERWHLKDTEIKQQYRQEILGLLKGMGFVSPIEIEFPLEVQQCIIFGARVERMEKRIRETVNYLKDKLTVSEHICLLGSNRKLISEEISQLKEKIDVLSDEKKREEWKSFFSDSEHYTEAYAFRFLWDYAVPQEMQKSFEDKIMLVNSLRSGNSYYDQQGHRATTETTIEDWMIDYLKKGHQKIFALAEQPYIRMADQFRFTVFSNGKKADLTDLKERIQRLSFHIVSPSVKTEDLPLISVILDEVGRNVYRTVETLQYLDKLNVE